MRKQLAQGMYAACAALAALPGAASAQQAQAVVNSRANLRAGPEQDYPVVAQLLPGTPVTVMGCVADYSWCDVALPDLRGWMYAGLLSYPYQGNNVPLMSYGSAIGFPIVSFSIGNYWNDYYRGRPWYRDRDRWERRPPPHFEGGRPGGYRPPEMHRSDDRRQPDWNNSHGGGRPDYRPPANNGGQWHSQSGRPPEHAGGGDHRGGRPEGEHNAGGRPVMNQRGDGGGGRPQGGQHNNAGGRPEGENNAGGRPVMNQRGGGGHEGGGQQRGGGDRGGDHGGHGQRGGDRDH